MWLAIVSRTLWKEALHVSIKSTSGAWVILVWNQAFSQLWKLLFDAVWMLEVGVVQALIAMQDFLEGVYDVYVVYVYTPISRLGMVLGHASPKKLDFFWGHFGTEAES